MSDEQPSPAETQASQKHPRGLYTLFFTEMWERLSYYGMRALLILFMLDEATTGGMEWTGATAAAIYGLYTAGVYLASLPGGWIADRLLGAQRAVWCGGILIACGHFVLAVPTKQAFFLGLMLIVLGTGLLKPNVSTLVGYLYPEGGARRDAGFSIFYMGINLGAFIGPLVCGYLGERIQWHYGFAAAGVGMVAGLIQFYFTSHYLGDAGRHPPQRSSNPVRDWSIVGVAVAAVAATFGLAASGLVVLDPVWLAKNTTGVILTVSAAYFAWALFFAGLNKIERNRVIVIGLLFIACAMFWAGFEQAGSSLNVFADLYTDRNLLGYVYPASWFQSVNAIFIIVFAPMFAALWIALGRRKISPSLTTKMAWGLLIMALGFVVMYFGAHQALASGKVWPTWLIATYLIHTFGELCLSPVGLSAVTKLAPAKLVGQMMGVWFVATSLGNLIAGLLAGHISGENLADMPGRFMQITITAGLTGIVYLLLAKPFKSLAGGVE